MKKEKHQKTPFLMLMRLLQMAMIPMTKVPGLLEKPIIYNTEISQQLSTAAEHLAVNSKVISKVN